MFIDAVAPSVGWTSRSSALLVRDRYGVAPWQLCPSFGHHLPGRAERRREGNALEHVATTLPRRHPACGQVSLLRICITHRPETLSGLRTLDLMIRVAVASAGARTCSCRRRKVARDDDGEHTLLDGSRRPRVAAVRCTRSAAPCSAEEHMRCDVLVRRERHGVGRRLRRVKRTSEAMSGRSLRGTKTAGVGACSAWRASVGARASVIAPRGALLARGGTSGYERSQGVVDGWPAIAWRSSPASRCGAPGGRSGTASGLASWELGTTTGSSGVRVSDTVLCLE